MAGTGGSMPSFTKVILPAVFASFIPAAVFWDLVRNKHVFGGAPARSFADEAWMQKTLEKFNSGWEREAGTPVVMNPISRENFRKV